MDTTVRSVRKIESVSRGINLWAARTAYALAMAVVSTAIVSLVMAPLGGARNASDVMRTMSEAPGFLAIAAWALFGAPVFETLIMAWLILLALDAGINRYVVVVLSALLWGAIHWAGTPLGWSVAIPFAVYSSVFIVRREPPHSDGFSVVTMAHFFYNLIVVTVGTLTGVINWHA